MKKNSFALGLISLSIFTMIAAFYRLEIGGFSLLQDVYGQDYRLYFDRALHFVNPYDAEGFYNPFWILPLVAVSEFFGPYKVAVWVTVNLCAFAWVCLRLKMPWWFVAPFMVFSGALIGAFVGNVEGLVALGMVLPSPFGIVLLMIKPQIGAAVTAYYVLSAFVYRGWKAAALMLAPVAVLSALSFILYGNWIAKMSQAVALSYNTIDFFPVGVPVGIALIVAGVSRQNVGYSLMAIPFIAPYMNYHTWAFPFMGTVLVLKEEIYTLREFAKFRAWAFEEGE